MRLLASVLAISREGSGMSPQSPTCPEAGDESLESGRGSAPSWMHHIGDEITHYNRRQNFRIGFSEQHL